MKFNPETVVAVHFNTVLPEKKITKRTDMHGLQNDLHIQLVHGCILFSDLKVHKLNVIVCKNFLTKMA